MKKKIIDLCKKFLPENVLHKLINIRDLPKKMNIIYSNYVLNLLKTDILDKDKKKIFSLRNFGGSTISRGYHLFSSAPDIVDWINKFEENSLFVDVGANVGIYSLYAAKKNHKVLALEPESLNFSCLNLNISDNKLNKKISAFPIAADEENKVSVLHIRNLKFGGSGNTFGRNVDSFGKAFEASFKQGSVSLKLDDIVNELNFNVNYVKIDVDGNELKVVRGMSKTLKDKNLKSICIELNPETSEGKEIIQILSKDFPNCRKIPWYKNQVVVDHIFEK